MSRADLTEKQLREFNREVSAILNRQQMAKMERILGELRDLRERESVTRFLHEIEGAV